MTEELKQLREALRRVKHEAASLADAQVIALEALTQRPAAQAGEREAPYGYCPECGAPGVMRERRPDGDDKCSNGHRYPSRSAHTSLPTQPAAQATPEPVGDVRCEGCGYMTHHREHMGCVRAAKQHTHPAPDGWTEADADAARLAMELECLLLDTKNTAAVSRWWKSANEALDLHRARLAAAQAKGDDK